MLVCGIDPGFRDLGLCVVRANITSKPLTFEILDWRVNDLKQWLPPGASQTETVAEDLVSSVVQCMRLWITDVVLKKRAPGEPMVVTIERQFNNLRLVALSHAMQACLELNNVPVRFVHSMHNFPFILRPAFSWHAQRIC